MADDKIIRIKLDGSSAIAGANKANRAVKGVGTSADTASNSLLSMSRVASAVITSLATTKIIKYADAWTNVNNRIKAATKTSLEFSVAQEAIIATAQRAGVDISAVADAYSRISQATSELGVSQERVTDVVDKLTLALKAGGATGAETSSVMIQFAQGLGSGALQGDELRSILESSIPITKALSKEFGVSTGELKKLGSEGKLTGERVVQAIENIDEKSLTFTKDISSGFTEVNNALTVYVGRLDESLAASENIAGVLSGLANNIDEVVEVTAAFIQLGAALYITNLTKALVANTGAFIANQAQIVRYNAALAAGAGVSRVSASATWALTYAMRALKAALPFGIILLGLEVLQNMLTATNDQIEANDRYAESTRKLNARLSTRVEKERAIALRTAAEVNARNQDKLAKKQQEIEEQRLKIERSNAAELAKIRGEEYNEADKLSLFQITKVRNRITLAEEEARRLEAIANRSQAAFAKIQGSVGGSASKSEVTEGAFVDSSQAVGASEKRQANRDLDSFFSQSGIFSGSTDNQDDSAFQATINREKLVTQQLQEEISARRAFLNGEINQRQLDEELALQEVYYGYEARRAAILENETITAEQRTELLSTLADQEILAEQAKLDAINNATDASLQDRQAMQEAYNQSVQALQMQTFSNATALLSSLNSESKAAALIGIGIQTATAYAANSAATAAAATLAFSSQLIPGDPTSIARATAAAAKATTLGSINGGLILASGAAKGLGALSGGGGGGATGSSSSGVANSSTSSATTASDTQNTTRIIDLRGFDNGGYLTKEQLTELLSGDEDVIVASNSGQQQGARVGLING